MLSACYISLFNSAQLKVKMRDSADADVDGRWIFKCRIASNLRFSSIHDE